jgi:hypothetical protein
VDATPDLPPWRCHVPPHDLVLPRDSTKDARYLERESLSMASGAVTEAERSSAERFPARGIE